MEISHGRPTEILNGNVSTVQESFANERCVSVPYTEDMQMPVIYFTSFLRNPHMSTKETWVSFDPMVFICFFLLGPKMVTTWLLGE